MENILYFELIRGKHPQDFPLELLLLADPSEKQIEKYIYTSDAYKVFSNQELMGVLVMMRVGEKVLEIKNIAVTEGFQGTGLGKKILDFAIHKAKEDHYQKLLIATANSSIGQLALYQKKGFEIASIRKNFFLENYPEPLFENGIPCKHQVCLEKILT